MEGGEVFLTLLQCPRLCEAVIAEVSFQDVVFPKYKPSSYSIGGPSASARPAARTRISPAQDCAGDPLNVSVPGRWNGSTVGFEVGHKSGTSEMAADVMHSPGSRGRLAQLGLGGQH